jgi:hypothetical protein
VRIVGLAEVKAKLSAFLDEAGTTGPVVITRNGRAVALLLMRGLCSSAVPGRSGGGTAGSSAFWRRRRC